MIDWARIAAWGLDFARAMSERRWIWRRLFRLVAGRYAYGEFLGLVKTIEEEGLDPRLSYGLQEWDYHERVVLRDWMQE